jgi:hypothetical protein
MKGRTSQIRPLWRCHTNDVAYGHCARAEGRCFGNRAAGVCRKCGESESGRQPTLALVCSPQLLQRSGIAASATGGERAALPVSLADGRLRRSLEGDNRTSVSLALNAAAVTSFDLPVPVWRMASDLPFAAPGRKRPGAVAHDPRPGTPSASRRFAPAGMPQGAIAAPPSPAQASGCPQNS